MVARVTMAEIDTLRMDVPTATQLFETTLAPALREQAGYEGLYVLATGEGKAVVLTFWTDEAAAEAAVASGFYAGQLEHYVTAFRSPPGREHYDVMLAEAPANVGGARS